MTIEELLLTIAYQASVIRRQAEEIDRLERKLLEAPAAPAEPQPEPEELETRADA